MRVLISERRIRRRVRTLAAEIGAAYPDPRVPLMLIGILNGSAVLLADLARAIARDLDYGFVGLSSYGAGTRSSGAVRASLQLSATVTGADVVIVEDILDTGLTLARSGLSDHLLSLGAHTVRTCALLEKTRRRSHHVAADFVGFRIADLFVVGYGMDLAGRYRNLPYIGLPEPRAGARKANG